MNLSNLIHRHIPHTTAPNTSSPRPQATHQYHHSSQPSQYRVAHSRDPNHHYLRDRDMAAALTANPYPYPYSYPNQDSYPPEQSFYRQAPQHPPSPPIEDFHTKCTLPSIQSLIGTMATSPSADDKKQCKSTCLGRSHLSTIPIIR